MVLALIGLRPLNLFGYTIGSSLALVSQTLNGAGSVKGALFVGSSSTLGGTLALSGNVQTGDASVVSPGGALAAGTTNIYTFSANAGDSFILQIGTIATTAR